MISHNQSAFGSDQSQPLPTIVSGKYTSVTEAEAIAGVELAHIDVPSSTSILVRLGFSSSTGFTAGDEIALLESIPAGTPIGAILIPAITPAFMVVFVQFEADHSMDIFVQYSPDTPGTRVIRISTEVVSERNT
jgi:hypothetical protein